MNDKEFKKKSNKIGLIVVFLAFIALILYMLFVDGIDKIVNIFTNCNLYWLGSGFLIMAFCWFIESYIINIGLKIFNKKLNFKDSASNCILGQFFSNLTPSATGGQPFQAYYMNKCGIGYGTSTSVLLIKFICFQISLTTICGTFIFLNFKELTTKIPGFSIIMLASFSINLVIAAALILIGYKQKVVIKIISLIFLLLKKLKFFKNPEEKFARVKQEFEFFNKNFVIIFKNKKTISYIMFLTIIQILSFYTINIAIATVFKINLNLWQMYRAIVGAACVQISSTFIPAPGAAGGAEIFYYVFYSDVFGSNKLSSALLLWRIYTFYVPLILGFLFFKNLNRTKTQNKFSLKPHL